MRTFLTIWTNPTKTFEYLIRKEKDDLAFNLNILFFLGSLAMGIPVIVGKSTISDIYDLTYVLLQLTAFSFLNLFIFKYLFVYLFWFIGNILQGKASRYEVRVVLAYSMITSLISLFLSFILMIVAIATSDLDVLTHLHHGSTLIIWLMGIHILIFGIAKFNKFTLGYTLINIILAFTILQGIGLLIKYLVK